MVAGNFKIDPLGDHKTKTQQVIRSRGQHCGDIELTGYLSNEAGPVPLVLDLRMPTTVSEVALTLTLMGTYITQMILIGH